MRHIMVLNAKGGCGKSTLATNIAAYFANEGASVALADFDPQRSSLDWLARRPENRPAIAGVAGYESGLRHAPRNADFIIIDAPARSHGKELVDLINQLRAQGAERFDAIVEAGTARLRPILMTSLTTALGLLPMAAGFGEGSEVRAPMAITVIGGLVVSTLLTLVVIPVVYSLMDRKRWPVQAQS